METHVIHDVRASMIIDQKVDSGQRVRSGNLLTRLFADDETGRTYYRLKSWADGEFAAEGIAVYVSEDLSEEQAIAAEDDHWRRLSISTGLDPIHQPASHSARLIQPFA